jgi:hypothetical protein
MRADIHGGPEQKLQSEAGYIDARPQTDSSTKTSCNARPDHTSGSFRKFVRAIAMSALPRLANIVRLIRFVRKVPPQAVAWAKAYLASSGDRQTLVQQLALTACRLGNDPHNQEIAQCLLEDYAKNRSFDRDRLLLACVQHTAVHR